MSLFHFDPSENCLIQNENGLWRVCYNGEERPRLFCSMTEASKYLRDLEESECN